MATKNTDSNSSEGKGRFSKGKVIAAAAAGVTAAAAAGYAAYKKSSNGSVKVYHLQPSGDDEGWEIRAEGADRATRTFETKDEALAAAREMARTHVPSELVIHRRDGSEADRHSYGQDPS